MDLSYYRFADCGLFRTPPVDFSSVKEEIERMLVTAWQSGKPAGTAIEEIAGNEQIVGKLSGQIEQSLLYQRSHAVDSLGREGEEQKKGYEAVRDMRFAGIEQTLGAAAAEKERELAKAAEAYGQTQGSYNAAQARLEELRAKVREQLKSIGGRQGYNALSSINRGMAGDAGAALPSLAYRPMPLRPRKPRQAYSGAEEAQPTDEQEGTEDAGVQAQAPQTPEGDEQGSLEEVIARIEEGEKTNIVRRFFGKVWSVLNYKIW